MTILSILSFCCVAQKIIIKGQVTDTTGEIIPFANVWLTSVEDSLSIKDEGITDLQGKFIITNTHSGSYLLHISTIGYKKIVEKVSCPTQDTIIVLNFTLKEDVKMLAEVLIKGQSITHLVDKDIYIISSQVRRTSPSALEALTIVPYLQIDPLNKTLTTANKGSVKLLIDGINATEKDLISLRPYDIVRVEYYDFPPARYALNNVAAVVNVITKSGFTGGNIGCSLLRGLTTSLDNDGIFGNYNKGKSRLGFYYYYGQRYTANRKLDEEYKYEKNGQEIAEVYKGLPSKFGYQVHNLKFDITNKEEKKYTFNLQALFNYYDGKRSNNQSKLNNNTVVNNISDGKSKNLNPSLDIYYSHNFGKNQIFSLNIIPSYFSSESQYQVQTDTSGKMIFNSKTNVKSKKKSLIAEVVHELYLKKYKLESGVNFQTSVTEQNLMQEKSKLNFSLVYLFTSFIGRSGLLTYSAGIGYSYVHNENTLDTTTYNFKAFRPNIKLSYQINNMNSVKLAYSISPILPDISDLNNLVQFTTPVMAYIGNPHLSPSYYHLLSLSYNFDCEKLMINPEINYTNSINPIVQHYSATPVFFYSQLINGLKRTSYNANVSLKYIPFASNIIKIYLQGSYKYDVIKTNSYINSLGSFIGVSGIELSYKSLIVFGQIGNREKSLSGQIISNDPATSPKIGILFNKPKWSVSAQIVNPFIKSYSISESFGNTPFKVKKTLNWVKDSNMILLGLSYNFSFGREYEDILKKIQNKDTDSGIKQNM